MWVNWMNRDEPIFYDHPKCGKRHLIDRIMQGVAPVR